MSKIILSCNDQELEVVEAGLIASGGVNEDTVIFQFCEKWIGFAKTAVFYQNKKEVKHATLVNDSCLIPWEVLKKSGILFIGVFGVKNGVTRTSNFVKLKIKDGAITEGTAVADPSPSVYEQLLSRMFGVHIGSEEPEDKSIMAWIDPDGEPDFDESIRGPKGDAGKSAYEYAKDAGYTGTEQKFAEKMAEVGTGAAGVGITNITIVEV